MDVDCLDKRVMFRTAVVFVTVGW